MDHHCPWVNNCIGFYNRKHFLLLLTYTMIMIYIAEFAYLPGLWRVVVHSGEIHESTGLIVPSLTQLNAMDYLVCIYFLINSIMIYFVTKFYHFHIQILLKNITTIENLDCEAIQDPDEKLVHQQRYNLGIWNNIYQVFGKNKLYWPVPFFGKYGKPLGNGVQWSFT